MEEYRTFGDELDDGVATTLLQKLDEADAVLVGLGAGYSAGAGLDYFDTKTFQEYCPEMVRLGYHCDYELVGMRDENWSRGRKWAYTATHINYVRNVFPVAKAYTDLLALLSGKDYFVVTSNCDRQIMRAGFPADRFFEIQGNYDDFGCSARCGVPSWDNHDDIQRALAGIDHERFECREETIPKCPVCGADARLCFRHSGHWDEDNARYQRFIEEHSTGKLLLLEMGVGLSTPGVIRTPFQRLTTNLEGAFLVRVILAYEGQPVFNWAGKIPESLAGKSLSVNADACKLVTALLSMRE